MPCNRLLAATSYICIRVVIGYKVELNAMLQKRLAAGKGKAEHEAKPRKWHNA